MGKTYRYDAEKEEANHPSWERKGGGEPCGEKSKSRKGTGHKRRDANPYTPMTPEWAIELMKDKVAMTVGMLLSQRVIAPYEREDYIQELNILVWNLLPQYDSARAEEDGGSASVERFLSVAIDNTAKNIKMRIARRRKNVPTVPFIDLGDDESEDSDGESDSGVRCEGNPFKTPRQYMEALWLKIDLEVLSRRLTIEERLTLACRLADFTYPEIAEYVSDRLGVKVLRYRIMETVMPSLRKKALECGFAPHSKCCEMEK